jgi:hypothetical protein
MAAVLLAASGCDLPRDNPLDPKNPSSARPRKILVEAFVNLHTGQPFDAYAVDALDSLAGVYSDRLVIAEVHRNVQQYTTPYHRSENEILYDQYLAALGSDQKGVPDVFVNGTEARIQGAASLEFAFFRIQQAVLAFLSDESAFSLDIRADTNAEGVTPVVSVARLGDQDATDLVVKAMLICRTSEPRIRRVVLGTSKSAFVPLLKHGEFRTLELPLIPSDGNGT